MEKLFSMLFRANMKFIHSNNQMNYLKIKMSVLIFACSVQICLSRNIKTKIEINDNIRLMRRLI